MAEALRGNLNDNFGRALSGVLVKVYDAGTSNLSSIFSDEALTVPITNDGAVSPLTEVDGSYGPFYAANGRYDIVPVKAGYAFDATDSTGELLFDPEIVRSVAATTTLTTKDYTLLVDASGGAAIVNLPALSSITEGRTWVVIKIDATANAVTIDPSGTETINGALTLVLDSTKQGTQFTKGGSEWLTYVPPAQTTPAAGKIPLGRASDDSLEDGWLRAQEASGADKVPKGRSTDGTLAPEWISSGLFLERFHEVFSWSSVDGAVVSNVGALSDTTPHLGTLKQATDSTSADSTKLSTSIAWKGLVETGKELQSEVSIYYLSSLDAHTAYMHLTSTTAFLNETASHFGWKIVDGRIWASSADGAVQEATDTSIDLVATTQRVRLNARFVPGTSVKFYIDGELVATHSTRFPAAGADMFPNFGMRTDAAVAKEIYWGRLQIIKEY